MVTRAMADQEDKAKEAPEGLQDRESRTRAVGRVEHRDKGVRKQYVGVKGERASE